jgi:hypothetical protein
MIVIENLFTGTTYPLENPRIGASPYAGTVTASTEAAGYSAVYAQDPKTDRWWKPTAFPATWDIDLGSSLPISYIGVAAHDCATAGASLEFETWDGSAWVARVTHTPTDNSPVFVLLIRTSHTQARVRVTGAIAKLGVIYVGDVMEVPERALYTGSQPFNEAISTEFTMPVSESGNWLDRIAKRRGGMVQMSVTHLSEDWFRDTAQPLLTFMETAPVFMADRPSPFPLSVAYGFTRERPQTARGLPNARVSRSLELGMVAYVRT